MARICCLVLLCATSALAASDALTLVPSGLSVQITGPQKLIRHGRGTPRNWAGPRCGFVVNWGDGTRTPDDLPTCADGLKHVYKMPGSYLVKAAIWHPGPDDAPRTDWSSSATVKVEPR